MVVEYQFRPGSFVPAGFRGGAQTIGERLEFLRTNSGLTTEGVLADACDEGSPLHPFFEWNDGEAARNYRLVQARKLIRSVVVVYRGKDTSERTVNAYVSVPDDGGRHYVSVVVSMGEPERRAAMLREAWSELARFRQKYTDLIEFATLFASMDEIEQALPKMIAA